MLVVEPFVLVFFEVNRLALACSPLIKCTLDLFLFWLVVLIQSLHTHCCERQCKSNLWEWIVILHPFDPFVVLLLEEYLSDDLLDHTVLVDTSWVRVKFLDSINQFIEYIPNINTYAASKH